MNFFKSIWIIITRIRTNEKVKDSGMRTDSNGNIYVDNKVFFNRKEVIDIINKSVSKNSLKN